MQRAHPVLILGNEPDLIDLCAPLEGGPEWSLECASSLEEALEKLDASEYSLVLAECCEMNSDAANLLRSLQAMRPKLKVIMITSASSAERVIEAMAERAYSYFSRPFEPDNVRYMMMQAIAQQEWEDGIEVLSALPEWLSLRLRCCLYTADRLLQFFSELKSDLPAAERAQTAMAFREMLINAIEHGGKLNGEEWVRVSRVRTRRTLIYHTQDPGEGFSRENLAHAAVSNPPEDPLGHIRIRGERGLRAGGFGLLVTKQMVDEVIHNQRGNEVVLVKHLD